VVLPIFDSGARRAGYAVATVDRDIAVAEYEKAIQAAFREVSDALSLRITLDRAAAGTAITHRYAAGNLSAFRSPIYGRDRQLSERPRRQRSVYARQQQMVGLRLARLSNLVALYKVLGGGV